MTDAATCPTCGRPFPSLWKPSRICAACTKPILKGHKFTFGPDSRVRHRNCDSSRGSVRRAADARGRLDRRLRDRSALRDRVHGPGVGHVQAGHRVTRKLMHPRERDAAKIVATIRTSDGRTPVAGALAEPDRLRLHGCRPAGFQEWTGAWAREVFRVLKPGAYIVVCCAPRSYHRMACGLEDAGFVIRDKFSWLFGSGFPKNYNLGDGKGTALKPAHEPIALAWKPFKGSIKACHEAHGTAALNIDACR
jgi:hypothetical protein